MRRWSADKGLIYGEMWTDEECGVADLLDFAYKNNVVNVSSAMAYFINEKRIN